jgi:predicted acetyltransferase
VDVAIRTVGEQEFASFVHATEAAFGGAPTPGEVENERTIAELDRSFAAFDGDEIVGTAAGLSLRAVVPGGAELPLAGVTGVGVLPSHRRRGINTALMRQVLDQARERGEPLAGLFASEGSIYGRFGFGLATLIGRMDIETDRSAFVRGYRASGRVRMRAIDDAIPVIVSVYERTRRGRPGAIALDERWVRYMLHEHGPDKDLPVFAAIHEGTAGPDAYAVYKIKHEWPGSVPQLELAVRDVQATTPQAYADMWRFLFDVDLVHRVTAWDRPSDEPLLHLLAEPRRLRLTLKDGLWLRLVDVPTALASRGYAGSGRLVLDVEDRFCVWNRGRFALEVGEGNASCAPTREPADLSCSVNDLGAVFLGGASFRRLHRANQVAEERPGALERADALFASDPAPWCPFVF